MLRKSLFILFLVTFFLTAQAGGSFALDWKRLHEEADRVNLKEAEALVREVPGSLDNLYILGLVYLSAHQDKQAGEIFGRIITLAADTLEAEWGRAEILRRQHQLDQSEEILTRIIELHPEFSPAYITLAYVKYTKMSFRQSVELAYKVIRQGKDNVDLSNYTRAYLLVAGGKGMLAYYGGPLAKVLNGTRVLPNLKKAEKLQPDSPAVLFGLGSFYFLSPALVGGNVDKAQVYLEKAIKLDEHFADAYVRLAQLYKRKGDNEKYRMYLERALELDPQNVLAQDEQSGRCSFICVSVNE